MKMIAEMYSRNYAGVAECAVRDEDVTVHYDITRDMDGNVDEINWYIEGLGYAGTKALGLSPAEQQSIEEDCIDDMNHSF